jgi:hypothetical protein
MQIFKNKILPRPRFFLTLHHYFLKQKTVTEFFEAMENSIIMNLEPIQNIIYEIRGYKVMLDFDLAGLYGIETRVLKQSVKRNLERFAGDDFMFELTAKEWNILRSQIVISSWGVSELKNELRELKRYVEDVFTDYNDINEDTRIQLELINKALAELQTKHKELNKPRRQIGFVIPPPEN